MEKVKFSRLEDFIALAKEGHYIEASIDVKKQIVLPKIHQGATGDMKSETEMYVLVGIYSLKFKGDIKTVTKPYMYGISEESTEIALQEMHIANERLKMDYERLSQANIIFEEKYFQY